jgi:hypothetical protein
MKSPTYCANGLCPMARGLTSDQLRDLGQPCSIAGCFLAWVKPQRPAGMKRGDARKREQP